jgi:hypothetical protein
MVKDMIKCDISTDEIWPVFSLEDASEGSMWTIEIPEDLYKEYIWVMYKYTELQLKLSVYYEQCQRTEFEASKKLLRADMQQNIN